MSLIAGAVWATIVALGPIELDFWTEIGVIFLGAYIFASLEK